MWPWAALLGCLALARAQDEAPPGETAAEEEPPAYGATATVGAVRVPGATRLEAEETRDLPGGLGDPFRAVDALPGVVPVLSGLPFVYVRGAPPSGNLHVYDDITLPALYHLAVGPAVIHPRMVGPIRLYTGVPPARYGRAIGGVLVGEGPGPPADPTRVHGETELRLLDLQGFVEAPVGDGTVQAAVRYGYPGLLLSIFSPETSLAYWDYQVRARRPVGARDEVEVVALGAYDSLRQTTEDARVTIHFHRAEARFRRRAGPLELGTALQLGWERSTLGHDLVGAATRFGPRLWLAGRGPSLRWRIGADFFAISGGFRGSFDGILGGPLEPIAVTLRRGAATRSISGVHGELTLRPVPDVELELGGRADAWVAGGIAQSALDPRARVTWDVRPDVQLHAGAGVTRGPVDFPLPLPGLAEVTIADGLQTSVQTEVGVAVDLPGRFRAELQLFWHRYDEAIFTEGLLLEERVCIPEFCEDLDIELQTDGTSYGGELFVRRELGERFSGFVSYTLAWAEGQAINGVRFVPNADTRHVANAVVQAELGRGWSAGLRMFARSGKPVGEWRLDPPGYTLTRIETRLPPFFRIDAHVAYAWRTSWGRMRVALEWFNATLAREALGLDCGFADAPSECPVEYAPAIFFPNLGVRGEL